jgi:DNA polymerase I-like protein with 3'-5' exonuclease and polymerase domains
MIRSFLRPDRGCKIVETDYKSLEVAINACYSGDPTLIRSLTDSSFDMHRSFAADAFALPESGVPKDLRQAAKGMGVFALFYGSYYKQVAPDLYEFAKSYTLPNEKPLLEHLKAKGIGTYAKFEKRIEEAERIMWEERFPVHAKWRKKQHEFYKQNGYVELCTGFLCYGPMSRNNTFNTPPQGSGYHVLQWTMNKVAAEMEKNDFRSYMFAEIHDAMVLNVDPSEEAFIKKWIY